jgi:hypothetical protein
VVRHVSILRRKPRTRRDRMLVRLHAVREGANRRWGRHRRHRRRRAAQLRVQELFLQLEQRLHPEPHEPVARARHRRPQIRFDR